MQIQVQNKWHYVLHKLFDHPSVVLIGGQWKTGKTDFALYIAETLCNLKLDDTPIINSVATNIDTTNAKTGQPFYKFVYDLRSLRSWLYSDTKRKLYIFDEVNEHLPSRRAMTAKNVGVIQLIPEISKAHARLLMIGHQLLSVDKTLIDDVWCRGIFIKLGLKKAQLMSHLLPKEYLFNNIPRTSVSFDPYTIAPFQELPDKEQMFKDVELQKLFEWANGKPWKELFKHPNECNRFVKAQIKKLLDYHSQVHLHREEGTSSDSE